MFENIAVLRMSHAMAAHAAARQDVIARNVAHADTPGFQAMDLPDFAETWRRGNREMDLRSTRPRHLDSGTSRHIVRPHPAPGPVNPNGNAVSLEREMVRAAETRHQHELALGIYRQARGILSASLGR